MILWTVYKKKDEENISIVLKSIVLFFVQISHNFNLLSFFEEEYQFFINLKYKKPNIAK